MRLLVVEDDEALRDVLTRGLVEAGYVVDAVSDVDQAITYLKVSEYGVCIIDWRLPGRPGTDLVSFARSRSIDTAILMLTARDAPADRIQALDLGADDYLVKPFDYGELLARLRALLRRPSVARPAQLSVGTLEIDPSTHETRLDGELIALTAREFAVLELLARRSPAVVSRRSIALQAWPEEADAVGSNTIEVHVARLRGKLRRASARIETVRGTGYRLIGP